MFGGGLTVGVLCRLSKYAYNSASSIIGISGRGAAATGAGASGAAEQSFAAAFFVSAFGNARCDFVVDSFALLCFTVAFVITTGAGLSFGFFASFDA